jgi:hypothetical protein
MEDNYIRFLRLWPDGYWVWKNAASAAYNFTAFVRSLDPAALRLIAETTNPPLADEGGTQYEVGRYRVADGLLVLSLLRRIATTTGVPLEVPWSAAFEIRSPDRLWFDAAKVLFDFVQDQDVSPHCRTIRWG